MSKSKIQKEAESSFNSLVFTGDNLSPGEWKKICIEMFKEGYWSATERAQHMIDNVVYKLDK